MTYFPQTELYQRVARGLVSGETVVRKFGRNAAVSTTFEPIWLHSGALSLLGPSGATVVVTSSSASDTSAGTGARTITLVGVDENWDAQTEVITMNGTSNVTSAETWGWVNSVTVTTAGTGRVNAGTITCTSTGSGFPVFIIAAGQGQTQQAVYATADGKTLEVHRVRLGSNAAKEANFQFGLELDPMNNTAPIVGRRYIGNVDGVLENVNIDLQPPTIIPGPSLLWVEGNLSSGSGGSLTAAFDAILY